MKVHAVKSWPQFFRTISSGERTHELRKNDRNYKIGDYLDLQEYDPEKQLYTGRTLKVFVTSITSLEEPCAVSGAGLHPEYCILSIRLGRSES
jgi:hypothetical protein